jgi:hypothetical protein
MKPPKLKKWDKLEVTWIDAHVDNGSVNTESFLRDFKPCIRKSLGYFVGTRLETLFICETDDREADVWDVLPQDCERLNSLPFGMIAEIKILT